MISKIEPWLTALVSLAMTLYISMFSTNFDKYIFGGALFILILSILMIAQE
jgi:hypothetical protein